MCIRDSTTTTTTTGGFKNAISLTKQLLCLYGAELAVLLLQNINLRGNTKITHVRIHSRIISPWYIFIMYITQNLQSIHISLIPTRTRHLTLFYIPYLTYSIAIFYMNSLPSCALNKLTSRLVKQRENDSIGTFDNPPAQPPLLQYIPGTIINNLTQPLINSKISTTSEIRVFLRYRSIKAILALKSPILQGIRRFLESVATNTHFSVNPHSNPNCHRRRTFPTTITDKSMENIKLVHTNNYNEK